MLAAYGELGAYGVSSLNTPVGAERAVDLVGRHVQKAESRALGRLERRHVPSGRFEQREGADDVRVDEGLGAVDRPIDVRFGRQIEDGVAAVHPRTRRAMAVAIGDVGLDESDARILNGPVEVQQAAGVGQLVDDDEAIGGVSERVVNEIGADEAGSARDEERTQLHRRPLGILSASRSSFASESTVVPLRFQAPSVSNRRSPMRRPHGAMTRPMARKSARSACS